GKSLIESATRNTCGLRFRPQVFDEPILKSFFSGGLIILRLSSSKMCKKHQKNTQKHVKSQQNFEKIAAILHKFEPFLLNFTKNWYVPAVPPTKCLHPDSQVRHPPEHHAPDA